MKKKNLTKPHLILSGETGSVMVLALMVMAIVSLIGVMTLNQSTAEMQVAIVRSNGQGRFLSGRRGGHTGRPDDRK